MGLAPAAQEDNRHSHKLTDQAASHQSNATPTPADIIRRLLALLREWQKALIVAVTAKRSISEERKLRQFPFQETS